ncbi:MAG: thrombospondin type 3 repeat-containing protein [Chloroflexota bacterium]|nr:thrombospondin type 3 repeat-containing protein [Chloroflexota bacterium]
MKLRLLAAIAVLALVGAFGGLFGGNVAEAACPSPANGGCAADHTFSVTLNNYTVGSAPDTTVNLALGTGSPASAPFPTAFFNEATTSYTGVAPVTPPYAGKLGANVGTIDFTIQTNVDPSLVGSNNINLTTGQPPRCGATGTLTVGSPTQIHAVTISALSATSPTVSSAPDLTNPPYTYDQEPDLSAGGGGAPMGVTHVPDWYPPLLTSLGIIPSLVERGYAIAKTTPASQTTVSFLTIMPPGGATINVTFLGNPIALFNPTSQTTSTCPPFSTKVVTQGTATAHTWDCTTDYFGNPIPLPGSCTALSDVGGPNQSLPAAGTFDYQITLSTGLNLDGDQTTATPPVPLWDQWDNCPADANPTQSDANSNGIGDACKAGGTVWTNVSAGAVTNASITCAPGAATSAAPFAPCQDADGDGVLNSVDNCPLTSNGPLTTPVLPQAQWQVDSLKDGIGDACRPGMAGNLAVMTDVPGTGVGYPTEYAAQDLCGNEFTTGVGALLPYCVANGINMPGGVGVAFKNSNAMNQNMTPDFMASFTKPSGAVVPCTQDHISDTNLDGYSDAVEGTPPGASCPPGVDANHNLYPTGGGMPVGALNPTALGACAGRNFGTSTSPATAAQNLGAKIARADVKPDGVVNIADLGTVASKYGQGGFGLDATDSRNELDVKRDGVINIADLGSIAAQYGKSVPPC